MKRVLIVGGSTRAAAGSARRAGLEPICADLFADWDTRQIADVIPVRDYPASLPQDIEDVDADGWFYTGGLENSPDLIEQMDRPDARYGPLLGTSAASLRLIRDPFWLSQTLMQAGIPALAVLPETANPPRDGMWIRKPICSAGGRAVCVWDHSRPDIAGTEAFYFQSRMHGATHSALFHNDDDAVEFLGVTQQLASGELNHRAGSGTKDNRSSVRRHWFSEDSEPVAQQPGTNIANGDLANAAEPFLYCGSIGPLQDSRAEQFRRWLRPVAELLASQCGLRGLFGIDFIPDSEGVPWILEVNPRYTASVEILELAWQRSLLTGIQGPNHGNRCSVPAPVIAKLILYAESPLIAPAFAEAAGFRSEWDLPKIADIPVLGSHIAATWPICSVMALGATRESCLQVLEERAKQVRKLLIGSSEIQQK